MANIYLLSGPCGCGKTTLSFAFAQALDRPVYLIHGDDFQVGFVTPEQADPPAWEDVLRFNWRCILDVARNALQTGTDVVIDYIVEDELPLVQELAREVSSALHYIVLTADEATLIKRLAQRGDAWLTERSLFLREKLMSLPENHRHLLDVTRLSPSEAVARILQRNFIV